MLRLVPLVICLWSLQPRIASANNESIDRFQLSNVASPQLVGQGFAVTVSARTGSGAIATNFNTSATLRAVSGSTILVTELDSSSVDRIELMNVSAAPVEVSHWQISVFDADSWPAPKSIFQLPAPLQVAAGGVFTLTDRAPFPGAYPTFNTATNFAWNSDSSVMAVLVRDAAGGIVDFVIAGDVEPAAITSPAMVPVQQWITAPLAANGDVTRSYQRIGTLDQNRAADWVLAVPTAERPNNNLHPPFAGTPIPGGLTPATTDNFTNGIWSGIVQLHQPGPNVYLAAIDTEGHAGAGNLLTVSTHNDLSIAAAVHPATGTIDRNLFLTLTVSNTGPAQASAVQLINILPENTTLRAALVNAGSCSNDSGVLRCELGTVPPGTSKRVYLILRPHVVGTLSNTATISRAEMDGYPANDVAVTLLPVHLPDLNISDSTVAEGGLGGSTEAKFDVTLSSPSDRTITVHFTTVDGTATAGLDYQTAAGPLTFPPGETNLTITVTVNGDALGETHEIFQVELSNPSQAQLVRSKAIGTIIDEDPPANDDYSNRTSLTGEQVFATGFNANATAGPGDPALHPQRAGSTLWWRWVAPHSGSATVSTIGTGFAALLAAYTNGVDLVAAAIPVSLAQLPSIITFDVSEGTEYQILVDSVGTETGLIQLHIELLNQRAFVPTEEVRNDLWDTDGTVNALLSTNGVLYLGGDFDYVFPAGRKVAAYDAYTGTAQPQFPVIHGTVVRAILADGKGGWFVGGQFDSAGNISRSNLVHVLPNNSIDPDFSPNPNGAVAALALKDNVLYVGGDFDHIDGQPRQRAAALHLGTGALSDWNPQANGAVTQLRPGAGAIYVGGFFTQIGGQARGRIAALDYFSGLATAWNPTANGAVLALQVQDNRAFVGGSFTSIGGVLRNGLASVDLGTGLVDGWNPNPSGETVTALQLSCDVLYLGGHFNSVGGLARDKLAAVDIQTGSVKPWQPVLASHQGGGAVRVWDLLLAGERLYVAGDFDEANGQPRVDLAALDAVTAVTLPWKPDPDGTANVLAISGGKLLAGFIHAPGGVARHNLAAFSLSTGEPLEWHPDPDNIVHALASGGGVLYVGGAFTNIGGQIRPHLAALDPNDGSVSLWAPNPNNIVHALVPTDTTLYAGGAFTMAGGQARFRIAELNLAGSAATSWNPGADQTVRTLALSAGTVYAGGSFSFIGGQSRNFLAALNRSTGLATDWNPNPNNLVRAIATDGPYIYIAGRFTSLDGNPHQRLAAIHTQTAAVLPWDSDFDGEVNALALGGSTLYAGGFFTHVNESPRHSLAAVEVSTGALLDWNPGASDRSEIQCLTATGQALYLGGRALRFHSSARELSFAAITRAGAPVVAPVAYTIHVPAGATASLLASVTGQRPMALQWYFAGLPLAAATNNTLTLSNVQGIASGTYTLLASNTLGSSTARIELSVLQPVQIVSQPPTQPQTNAPGSTVVLSVGATGSPPPLYQWRLNGVNIPGAVFPTLTLANVQPADSGIYHVVIANSSGALNSNPVALIIPASPLMLADNFAARTVTNASFGQGSASNLAATREQGEPLHVSKLGGRSVWFGWTAPADGLASFSTAGSDFDTMLAVYSGAILTNLSVVASDEDRGGFLTSEVTFQAVAGTEYAVAIDGLAGASGRIVLRWMLDTNSSDLPRIFTQPRSQSVAQAADAVLTVTAAASGPVTYQWFAGCRPLAGATNDILIIRNVQPPDVDDYRVVVSTATGAAVASTVATVEIGPVFDIVSQDKLEDLFAPAINAADGGSGAAFSSSSGGFVSVSVGAFASQWLNNSSGNSQPSEPNHCGVSGGASKWLGLMPETDGILMVDTIGSEIDTVLAAYQATNLLNLAAGLVACDNDGAPDGVRSLVQFPVHAGTRYLIVVDGVNGARGPIQINWVLGIAPAVNQSLLQPVPREGSDLELAVDLLAGNPAPSFQWWRNGAPLIGATNRVLTVQNIQRYHQGAYSVSVSNFAGSVSYLRAQVSVDVTLRLQEITRLAQNRYHLSIDGNSGQNFLLQMSPDLSLWHPVMTNQIAAPPVIIADPDSNPSQRRFYRVRPWP